jgi:methylenetetrahydrofolate dehydrogenase (NADP+)/methenyltetrahydrofolate cyclohydrolase
MTQAVLVDGTAIAANVLAQVATEVTQMRRELGIVPTLALILLDTTPAGRAYVEKKVRACEQVGIETRLIAPEAMSERELLATIAELNHDRSVHGIFVQLAELEQVKPASLLYALDPAKDVDGFNAATLGRLLLGEPCLVPCIASACHLVLQLTLSNRVGLDAVVVGRSSIVAKPVAQLLLNDHCTVTVVDAQAADLPGICRRADILVAVASQPELIRGAWLKPGVVIVDTGMHRSGAVGRERTVGDVHFDEAAPIARAITPVPGCIGPLTIACLLRNTVRAARGLDSST